MTHQSSHFYMRSFKTQYRVRFRFLFAECSWKSYGFHVTQAGNHCTRKRDSEWSRWIDM